MSKFKPLLFALLGFSVAAGTPLVAHGQATHRSRKRRWTRRWR